MNHFDDTYYSGLLSSLLKRAKRIRYLEEKPAQMFIEGKEALLEQQPLTFNQWNSVLRQLESGQLESQEVNNILNALDGLIEKFGENAVIPFDADLEDTDYPHNPLLQTLVENLIEKFRHYSQSNRTLSGRSVRNVLKHWREYSKHLHDSLNSKHNIRNENITRYLAQLLSISDTFQMAAQNFREKWSIEPSSEFVNYLFRTKPHFLEPNSLIQLMCEKWNAEKTHFNNDLNEMIFSKFPLLNQREDYGLIIASLCVGLTPNEVIKCWKEIWLISSHGSERNLEVLMRVDDAPNMLGAFLTIAYLSELLGHVVFQHPPEQKSKLVATGTDKLHAVIEEAEHKGLFPPVIIAWMKFAETQYKEVEKLGFGNLPEVIELIQGLPSNYITRSYLRPDISVRITSDTLKSHFQQLWPKIEMTRIREWGQTSQTTITKDVEWREYERDSRLKALFDEIREEGSSPSDRAVALRYEQKYRDEYLSHNPFTAEELVKKARQRWKRKIEQLEGRNKH
jgi:hypothetical protein